MMQTNFITCRIIIVAIIISTFVFLSENTWVYIQIQILEERLETILYLDQWLTDFYPLKEGGEKKQTVLILYWYKGIWLLIE